MNAGQLVKGAGGGAAGGAMGGPVGMAIGAGVGLLGSLFGAKSQSKAIDKASQVEERYNNRALDEARAERDYTRGRDEEQRNYDRKERQSEIDRLLEQRAYDRGEQVNYRDRLQPFVDPGVRAVGRLDRGLATNMAASAPFNGNTGGMIQVQGPNGKTYSVPASQQAHWAKVPGATILGAS